MNEIRGVQSLAEKGDRCGGIESINLCGAGPAKKHWDKLEAIQ